MAAGPGGGSIADHHEAAAELAAELGWDADDIEPPPDCPDQVAHVMGWYYELASARSAGMSGPNAISFPEIEAWARMTGRIPDQFEVRCLTIIDGLFRQAAAKAADARRKVKR